MYSSVLICGFMGSGKSTFAQKLSQTAAEWTSFDLDDEICRALNIPNNKLGDWIRAQGIPAFRQLEIKILTTLIAKPQSKIISLGGGTLEAEGFWDLKDKTNSDLVYLKIDLKTCLERTEGDSNRPLRSLSDDELKKLHTEREKNYILADLILTHEQIKEIDDIPTLVHNLRGL
jgi:shikimate kinase